MQAESVETFSETLPCAVNNDQRAARVQRGVLFGSGQQCVLDRLTEGWATAK